MKFVYSFLLLIVTITAIAQSPEKNGKEIKFKMAAANWTFESADAEVTNYEGKAALHIKTSDKPAFYKNFNFYNGTIEYDLNPIDENFCGIYFRVKNEGNGEYFYLRNDTANEVNAADAIQYAPTINGLTYWILFDYYQGAANFKKGEWNHIKLVISGYQMLVYVNNMEQPALAVSRLEGDFQAGLIGFDGASYISNIVIKPDATGDYPL